MKEPRRLKPFRLDDPAEPLAVGRTLPLRTEPAPTEPGERVRLPPTRPDDAAPRSPWIAPPGDGAERSPPPARRRAHVQPWLVVLVGACLGGLFFAVFRGRLTSRRPPIEPTPSSTSVVAPPSPTVEARYSLTARPVDLDETKGAWAYGNECYKRWRARDLDLAERYCLTGLAQPDAVGKVRGAIYYNLGLIAESRGEWAKAEEWLEGSLNLRAKDDPGRAYVEAALERVRRQR